MDLDKKEKKRMDSPDTLKSEELNSVTQDNPSLIKNIALCSFDLIVPSMSFVLLCYLLRL